MNKKRWTHRHPSTMQEAIRLCLDYALHKHNRSVAQVAELIGTSEWVIYKWMSDGSLPSKRIRPFEFATDATYVTQHLAASAQKLVVDIPRGKSESQDTLMDLQNAVNTSVQLLCQFYKGDAEAGEVMAGITTAMNRMAGHRENVRKHLAPELPLFSEDEA
jgi:hypothetical protein